MATKTATPRITKTSPKGIEIITAFEGFEPAAYLCPANVWTIGYGSTRYPDGRRVKQGDRITKPDALKLFAATLGAFEKAVDDYTRDDIEQHEFDALVSLCYNIGPDNFRKSSLLREVNMREDEPALIAAKFCLFNKAKVRGLLTVLRGLDNRRKSEAHLFNTGLVKIYTSK